LRERRWLRTVAGQRRPGRRRPPPPMLCPCTFTPTTLRAATATWRRPALHVAANVPAGPGW